MSESGLNSYTNSIESLFRSGDSKAHEKIEETSNVRLIQNLIMAIGRDDMTSVSEMLAEDVRLEIISNNVPPFLPEAKGRTEMLEAVKHNFGIVQNQRLKLGGVVAQGDTVIILMEEEGEIRATGKNYRIKGMQRFIIRESKVELVEELFLQM